MLMTVAAMVPRLAGQQETGGGCRRVEDVKSEKLSEILTPGGRTPNMLTVETEVSSDSPHSC